MKLRAELRTLRQMGFALAMVPLVYAGNAFAQNALDAYLQGQAQARAEQRAQEESNLRQLQLLNEAARLILIKQQQERMELERQREVERQAQARAEAEARAEAARRQAEEQKRTAISTGTGFFVTKDGYLITNRHVVEDKAQIAVRDNRGRFYRANVVAKDAGKDLALLRVTGDFAALNVVDSKSVTKGQRVLAIGYPNISIQGSESKVTDGIISSFSGLKNDDGWFQISVPIQGGNSGGPLVTESGAVVGVVVATVNVEKYYSSSGNLPQNVNYAIKSNTVRDFLGSNGIASSAKKPSKTSLTQVDDATVMVIASNELPKLAYQSASSSSEKPSRAGSGGSGAPSVPGTKQSPNTRLEDAQLKIQSPSDGQASSGAVASLYSRERYYGRLLESERAALIAAAQGGNPAALAALGWVNIHGMWERTNVSKGLSYMRLAADKGSAYARTSLGLMYMLGQGVTKDYSKAIELFMLAAASGDSEGQYFLGRMYEEGRVEKKDIERAKSLFSKSAEKGNPLAAGALNSLDPARSSVSNSTGMSAEGMDALRQAQTMIADGAYVEALPKLRLASNTERQSVVSALSRIHRKAEMGDQSAALAVSEMYAKEWGVVAMDFNWEMLWLKQAVNIRDPAAAKILGARYWNGGIVAPDPGGAGWWLEIAATSGDADSQYEFGRWSQSRERPDEAKKWFERAAQQGHRKAAAELLRQ